MKAKQLRIWQVAPRVRADGRPNALLRLAIRSARNLAIDEARRARRSDSNPETLARALEDADTAAGELEAPDPWLRQAIVECRDALPDKPRAALSARIESIGSEPDAALAARLGMRLNTFLQNVTRAKRLLSSCLEGRGFRELVRSKQEARP